MTTVTKVTAQAARKDLDQLIDRAAAEKERIVLTRRGKNVVALVPIEDLELLENIEDQIDVDEAREVLARLRSGEESTVPWEKIKKDLGL